ncbi:3-hydroxyacyl-ACP dehydratase [Streptomyces sp. PTM05]|uniref:3-hydroxyacyl-ACP dehydratase n=1 Tax=Streptantibioticus parmotrematis TaxID=2873249 RepID=A0ABS7QT55_9ACTN|nr:3-hydroxyacyl-ACP dehydratase [Streptantibioticus parmotrematis]MBY8886113.1 3-hydroxyacyl-ACP dehydratase [Streptantibioticus parmotrematis]
MEDLAFDHPVPLAQWWPPRNPPRAEPTTPHPGPAGTRAGADAPPAGFAEWAVTAHEAVLRTHAALQNLLIAQALRGAGRDPAVNGDAVEGSTGAAVVAKVHAVGESTGSAADDTTGAMNVSLVWHHAPPRRADDLRGHGNCAPGRPGWSVRHNGRLLAEARRETSRPGEEEGSPTPGDSIRREALWRPERHVLSRDDLDALSLGRIDHVFAAANGPEDPGAFATWSGLIGADLLEEVALSDTGAATGRLRAASEGDRSWTEVVRAAWQLLAIRVLHDGLHLCLPDACARPAVGRPVAVRLAGAGRLARELTLRAEVTASTLVPRPRVRADVEVLDGSGPVGWLRGVEVVFQETADSSVMPGQNGPGRRSSRGEPVYANELHMAHACEGDLAVTYGPAAHATAAAVRPRLPRGDLLMLNRLVTTPRRGYPIGTTYLTEYDVPQDPWYVRDNAGVVPWFARLEMALQAAAFVGAALGSSLEHPGENLTVRNLEGHAELLHPLPLEGRTVRQRTTLLSHTPLPGALLQRYRFELAVDDEVFQRGETVHGFFTQPVLAQQRGLDGGRHVLPWLFEQPERASAADRFHPEDEALFAEGRLALLRETECLSVPDGGQHRKGYLLLSKRVQQDDWFFGRHFLDDPVLPGSCGVELLFQALRSHLLHSGALPEDTVRALVPAPEQELRWAYRGQILPCHQRIQAEVHVRDVRREREHVLCVADGSVWRDGLRIYAVDGIALRSSGLTGGRGRR